jgi:hypothetical protein
LVRIGFAVGLVELYFDHDVLDPGFNADPEADKLIR